MSPWVLGVLIAAVSVLCLAAAVLIGLDRFARSRRQDLGRLRRQTVDVHGQSLTLLVADTPSTLGPGLAGQRELPADQGLLLVSPDGDTRVTMLGMRFALDVLWLDATSRVVDLRQDMPRRPWPLSYSAGHPAAAVLELPAGSIDRYAIARGDVLVASADEGSG